MTGTRLLDRLDRLSAVGADPAGGVTRFAYTPDDVAARDLVGGWMVGAGLTVTVDAATNLVGRRPGTEPDAGALVIGSHLDTVRQGGPLDGAYGVVAAVDVAQRLIDRPLRHGLTVVAFANEEGTTAPPFTGSRTLAGHVLPLDDPLDADGRTLRTTLVAAGGRPDELATAAWPEGSVAAMVELHIEQGPVLEAAGIRVGVVEAITGRQVVDLVLDGRANHAGTTPMELRHDALVVAAEIVGEADRLAREGRARVLTVGRLEVVPNVRNVVPGLVRMSVDVRDADDALVRKATTELLELARARADEAGVELTVELLPPEPGVATSPIVQDAIEAAAAAHQLSSLRLPSGAGHDAQVIAELAPVGMIFVPSIDGVSHSPRERSHPEDLVAGADVLHDTIVALDGVLP